MSSIGQKRQPEFFLAKDSCVTVNRSLDKANQRVDKAKPKKAPVNTLKMVTQLSKVKSQTNLDSVASSYVRPEPPKKPLKTKTLKVDLIPFKPPTSIRKKLSMSELVQIPAPSTKGTKIDDRTSMSKIIESVKKITTNDLNILLGVEKLLFEFLHLIHRHQDIYDHFKIYIDFVQEHNFEPFLVI